MCGTQDIDEEVTCHDVLVCAAVQGQLFHVVLVPVGLFVVDVRCIRDIEEVAFDGQCCQREQVIDGDIVNIVACHDDLAQIGTAVAVGQVYLREDEIDIQNFFNGTVAEECGVADKVTGFLFRTFDQVVGVADTGCDIDTGVDADFFSAVVKFRKRIGFGGFGDGSGFCRRCGGICSGSLICITAGCECRAGKCQQSKQGCDGSFVHNNNSLSWK